MSYQQEYENVKSVILKLGRESQSMMEHCSNLHKTSIKSGEIPNKYKELIALGISISIRCNAYIIYLLNDALTVGPIYSNHAVEPLHEIRNLEKN